jgi:hypothetical protein
MSHLNKETQDMKDDTSKYILTELFTTVTIIIQNRIANLDLRFSL